MIWVFASLAIIALAFLYAQLFARTKVARIFFGMPVSWRSNGVIKIGRFVKNRQFTVDVEAPKTAKAVMVNYAVTGGPFIGDTEVHIIISGEGFAAVSKKGLRAASGHYRITSRLDNPDEWSAPFERDKIRKVGVIFGPDPIAGKGKLVVKEIIVGPARAWDIIQEI